MSEEINSIGILAYGSLVTEPGLELDALIDKRINCETPFEVEFARISKNRDLAPTLIPVKDGKGKKVKAQILVLKEGITIEEAQSILWRRETRITDKSRIYKVPLSDNKNAVSVKLIDKFCGIDKVLYTSIPANMGNLDNPEILARFAIQSILSEAGNKQLDGVRYLQGVKNNGLSTPKSHDYETAILKSTGSKDLEAAITKLDRQRPENLRILKDIKKFEEQVIPIADLAFQYGFDTTVPVPADDPKIILEQMSQNRDQFFINCHTGFKKAQELILELILQFQEETEENKIKIKACRKSKNIHGAKKLEQENRRLEFKEGILRHIIDGIAWQMIDGQLYIARRLYQGVKGNKMLKHSNIESVVNAARSINENKKDFALISDLSGYIQIGDLLCIKNGQRQVIELKEGENNHKILETLQEILNSEESAIDILKKKQLDKKSVEQLVRQFKQYAKGQNFADIVNTDKGIDTETGKPINIKTPEEITPRYDKEFSSIREQLETRNLFGYNVIDGCLHIGMYKGDFKFAGERILRTIVEQNTKNYISEDLRAVIYSMNRPIFFYPFPKEFIFDVLFGRIYVHFILDLDKYIELYINAGYKAEWANRKETMRAKEQYSKDIFTLENRGIKITLDKVEMWISHGTFSKIFFELIYPTYTAYATKYYKNDSEINQTQK